MLLVKLSLLILFAYFLASVLCFFLDGFLSKVIALPNNAIVGRAITIWKAIQKRSHEPIYKAHTKIEAKKFRGTTYKSNREKFNIAISIL